MIVNWKVLITGQSLFSFIELVSFCHGYDHYIETRLKPLQRLVKSYYRKPVHTVALTPELVKLFSDLKLCIPSSPVLARFDPAKPTFLQIDWSIEGVAWICIQPSDDQESV